MSDVNDAPTSAVSPRKRQLFLSTLNQNAISQIRSQYTRGNKTKCVKGFLLITHFDQQKRKIKFASISLMICINSNHNKFSRCYIWKNISIFKIQLQKPNSSNLKKKSLQIMYKMQRNSRSSSNIFYKTTWIY